MATKALKKPRKNATAGELRAYIERATKRKKADDEKKALQKKVAAMR